MRNPLLQGDGRSILKLEWRACELRHIDLRCPRLEIGSTMTALVSQPTNADVRNIPANSKSLVRESSRDSELHQLPDRGCHCIGRRAIKWVFSDRCFTTTRVVKERCPGSDIF